MSKAPYEEPNFFDIEDITMVRIETREEVKARFLAQANRHSDMTGKVITELDPRQEGFIPDILITYEFCGNNSSSGEVFMELWDTGDEEEKCYDMSFSTDNHDNWGIVTSMNAIQLAVQKHFELGLHKRFQTVGED